MFFFAVVGSQAKVNVWFVCVCVGLPFVCLRSYSENWNQVTFNLHRVPDR